MAVQHPFVGLRDRVSHRTTNQYYDHPLCALLENSMLVSAPPVGALE
jgi:hypothetical protein